MSELVETGYGGLDRRVGAFFLDVLLVYLASAAIQAAIYALIGGFPLDRSTSGSAYLAWFLLTFSLPLLLYFTLLESSLNRATPAKRLLKLRVVDLQGERIGFRRALLRSIFKLLPWELLFVTVFLPDPLFFDPTVVARPAVFLLYLLLGLYMLAMIFSPRKRGIHDLLAGTLVMIG
ncbi:MAG TPA: RDD family protein [Anaerolineales bacterium]|nr:RDD family protein [Anaerolineales bacterium]